MNELQKFLDNRLKEIDQYFHFLNQLEIDHNRKYLISVCGDSMPQDNTFELNQTHTQILKSTCFLLLYNSLEGTVYKSLEFIVDQIKDEKLSYIDVLKEIREMWLSSKFPTGTKLDELDSEKIFERMNNLLSTKIEIDLVMFREQNRGYFGKNNLNDDVIHKELLPKIGINLEQKISEPKLDEIKTKRNSLAHGGTSFSELGKTTSFIDLTTYKQKTFRYLEKYVTEISKYVDEKKYKAS